MFSVNFWNYKSSSFQEGSHVGAVWASPHTQPSYSLLWLLTLTAYTRAKRFNQTHRKIGAYCFASQRIHLKGDVNNNNSCYPFPTRYTCLDLSSPHDACQKRKIKRNREKNFDSLHKSKYWKVKDRPFAEGSRGCHALICLYAQSLSAKERPLYCPLWWQPLLCSLSLLLLYHHKFVQRSIFTYTNDLTLLEAIFIALLHRWQLTRRILLNT